MRKQQTILALSLAAVFGAALLACNGWLSEPDTSVDSVTKGMLIGGVQGPVVAPSASSGEELRASDPGPGAEVNGSVGSVVALTPSSCSYGSSATVRIAFTASGPVRDGYRFTVLTEWETDGVVWTASGRSASVEAGAGGSDPAARPADETHWFDVTLTNRGDAAPDSTAILEIRPTVAGGGRPGRDREDAETARVHVWFVACDDGDETPAPRLVVPRRWLVGATSPAGAKVFFSRAVRAWDHEGSLLTGYELVCSPASGTLFGFQDTEVTCTATDGHGRRTRQSFVVHVHDTPGEEMGPGHTNTSR